MVEWSIIVVRVRGSSLEPRKVSAQKQCYSQSVSIQIQFGAQIRPSTWFLHLNEELFLTQIFTQTEIIDFIQCKFLDLRVKSSIAMALV